MLHLETYSEKAAVTVRRRVPGISAILSEITIKTSTKLYDEFFIFGDNMRLVVSRIKATE